MVCQMSIALMMFALVIEKTYLVLAGAEWFVGSDSILDALWLSSSLYCEKVKELEL